MRPAHSFSRMILLSLMILPLLSVAAVVDDDLGDDVPHVRNGDVPEHGVETWAPVEAWRAGGEDDEVFFGSIERVLAGPGGEVLAVDLVRNCVQVFGPDGVYRRALSREGDGPGEVRAPYDLAVLPDGVLALPLQMVGKVVRLRGDGTPASNWSLLENYTSINTVLCRGGNLVMAGQYSLTEGSKHVQHFILARHFLADGCRQHIYEERENVLDFADFTITERNFFCARQGACALGPDGCLYTAADRDAYRINVYRPDGALDRVIERAWTPLPRSEEEKARVRAQLEDDVRNISLPKTFVVSDTDPVINRLHVDETGNLWVQHARSGLDMPAGVMLRYDVFDARGLFDRQVSVVCAGDSAEDELQFVDDHHLALLIGAVGGDRAVAGAEDRALELVVLGDGG